MVLLFLNMAEWPVQAQVSDTNSLSNRIRACTQIAESNGFAPAEQCARDVVQRARRSLGDSHTLYAHAIGQLATFLGAQSKFAEAERLYRETIPLFERAYGSDSRFVGTILVGLAQSLMGQHRCGDAAPYLRRAASIFHKLQGTDRQGLAGSLAYAVQIAQKDRCYEQALEILRLTSDSDGTKSQSDTDTRLTAIGDNSIYISRIRELIATEKFEQARIEAERLLHLLDNTAGRNESQHKTVLELYQHLVTIGAGKLDVQAMALHRAGKPKEAEEIVSKALVMRERAFGHEHTSIALTLNNLGLMYLAQGRYGEAEPILRRAIVIREKLQSYNHPDLVAPLTVLGAVLASQGRRSDAEPIQISL
jgi:tetratricopeptide (TPR) repeat protein